MPSEGNGEHAPISSPRAIHTGVLRERYPSARSVSPRGTGANTPGKEADARIASARYPHRDDLAPGTEVGGVTEKRNGRFAETGAAGHPKQNLVKFVARVDPSLPKEVG
jgi:hypothetical protein